MVSPRRKDFRDARQKLLAIKVHKRAPRSKGEPEACRHGTCECPTLSHSTANRRMAAISKLISDVMKDEEWLTRNPAQIGALTEGNQREILLEDAEVKRLLAEAMKHPEPCMHAMIVAAMASGARAGELQSLRW